MCGGDGTTNVAATSNTMNTTPEAAPYRSHRLSSICIPPSGPAPTRSVGAPPPGCLVGVQVRPPSGVPSCCPGRLSRTVRRGPWGVDGHLSPPPFGLLGVHGLFGRKGHPLAYRTDV